jgi:ABC-type polar amino acid transport system ATPase subunit
MTTLLVTHDIDFARDVADRVLFLDHGRVDCAGDPAHVLDGRPTPALRDFLQGEKQRPG